MAGHNIKPVHRPFTCLNKKKVLFFFFVDLSGFVCVCVNVNNSGAKFLSVFYQLLLI